MTASELPSMLHSSQRHQSRQCFLLALHPCSQADRSGCWKRQHDLLIVCALVPVDLLSGLQYLSGYQAWTMQQLLWQALGAGARHAAPLLWKAPAKLLLPWAPATCCSAAMK